jgi:hypothetical protein
MEGNAMYSNLLTIRHLSFRDAHIHTTVQREAVINPLKWLHRVHHGKIVTMEQLRGLSQSAQPR